MNKIRRSAVAGYFYPSNKEILIKQIKNFLENATLKFNYTPYALICPHAGYVYSGPIAGFSYKTLLPNKKNYKNIIILGPSHFEYVNGIAYISAEYFETPLGNAKVDLETLEKIKKLDFLVQNEDAHKKEHSIEVQIPFIQYIFQNDIPILPLAFGKISPEKIKILLETIWNPETLIIISSDLSHYYDYDTAKKLDKQTSDAILNLDSDAIQYEQACGRIGIQGLLMFAKEKNWKAYLLDLRNSGDTSGSKTQVVGYGAWSFTDETSSN